MSTKENMTGDEEAYVYIKQKIPYSEGLCSFAITPPVMAGMLVQLQL